MSGAGTGVEVAWISERERDVAVAAGFRIRGGSVEYLAWVENRASVRSVQPATPATLRLWGILLSGESSWGVS